MPLDVDVRQARNVEVAIGNRAHWTKPEGNTREHWRTVYRRGEAQKRLVREALVLLPPPRLPVVVTLTRVSGGNPMDSDNLSSALKRVRDEVARWCGCGDSPKDPITWRYAQERGPRGYHAVRIDWGSDGPARATEYSGSDSGVMA